MKNAAYTIRNANKDDVPEITKMIHELAAYEQLADQCKATAADIQASLFSDSARAYVLIAEYEGRVAGFALYFYNYSTFLARAGIYIEDVYVREAFRRKGIARGLFHHIANRAVAESCGRVDWSVLNWNEDAIAFYRAIGAVPIEGWTVQRLTGDALLRFAQSR